MIDVEIPQKVHDSLEFIKKYEPIDENYMLQQVLLYGIRDLEQDMAIKLYSEGKITISECAQMAEKSVGEMMELLTDRGIKSKITIEDFEEGLSNALDLLGN